MKKNVTELFQNYRHCLRHIWNSFFWQHPHLRSWDSLLVFERLKPHVFRALVQESLTEDLSSELVPSGNFEIVPNIPDNYGNLLATHVVVVKQEGGGRSWSDELPTLSSADATLRFVDVFDWLKMGYVDLRYYLAVIIDFPSRPDLKGYEVLIDVYQADVFWVPAEGGGKQETAL